MITVKTQWLAALAFAAVTSMSAHAYTRASSDDTNIATSVEAALDAAPSFGSASSVQVQSIDGVVYLHGLVETYPEKLLAQTIAARTPGVDRVVNAIELHNE
jgi:osmotically-inducible protein OsmY